MIRFAVMEKPPMLDIAIVTYETTGCVIDYSKSYYKLLKDAAVAKAQIEPKNRNAPSNCTGRKKRGYAYIER
jgi:hypothetical protein